MRILVLASTPIGCLVATMLAQDEELHEVVLVHPQSSLVTLVSQQNGFLLNTGDNIKLVILQAFTTFEEADEVLNGVIDVVFVAMRPLAVRQILHEMGPALVKKLKEQRTQFCLLHLSLSTALEVSRFFSRKSILLGSTLVRAAMSSGASIDAAPNRMTEIWPMSDQVQLIHRSIAKILTDCGLSTTLTKQASVVLWKKLAIDCAINSVTSLLRVKIGQASLGGGGSGRELMKTICHEVVSIALQEYVEIQDSEMESTLDFVCAKGTDSISPMCRDVLHRKQTETDYQGGTALRYAKRHKIPAPILRAMHYSVLLLQDTYRMRLPMVDEPEEDTRTGDERNDDHPREN